MTALLLAIAASAAPVAAHPSDEAAAYHYLWIEARPGRLALQHATIVGGLLTAREWPRLDPDGDRTLSGAEQQAAAVRIAAGLALEIEGRAVPWRLERHEFPSHDEFFGTGLPAVKLELAAPLPKLPPGGLAVTVRDSTYPEYTGVFPQPVVRAQRLTSGTASFSEDGRTVRFRLLPAGVPAAAALPGLRLNSSLTAPGERGAPGAIGPKALDDADLNRAPLFPARGQIVYAAPRREDDGRELRRLLDRPLTPALVALALGTALLLGAAHALTPGHGKAMVAAYLVGSRGTVSDAVLLGIVVTLAHTASVYVLGFLSLWLTTRLHAETVGRWLSVVSGVMVLGMGFWLFQRGLLAYHGVRELPGHRHEPGGHSHAHDPEPAAVHEPGHSHSHAHEHSHECAPVQAGPAERRLPSDAPLEGGSAAAPRRRSWDLIALGMAGGMVPCFDALAVLVAAVHLNRIAAGLALIAAFSLGMALVLVTIGVLLVTARGMMARFTGDAPWIRALPAVSGAVLLLLGAWLTLTSLE